MYIPKKYVINDSKKIEDIIRKNSFGILVTTRESRPIATHIPLMIERFTESEKILMGHISKGNEQKHTLIDDSECLAIFHGEHTYISPQWYTALEAPSWNYLSVHVYGKIKIIVGDELKMSLRAMIDWYESAMPKPMKMEDIPQKTFDADFNGIVGFKIIVTEIQAAGKLSQNRDKESFQNIIYALEKSPSLMDKKIAKEMIDIQGNLF